MLINFLGIMLLRNTHSQNYVLILANNVSLWLY